MSHPYYGFLVKVEQGLYRGSVVATFTIAAVLFVWCVLLDCIDEWPRMSALVIRNAVGHIFGAQQKAMRETLQERNERYGRPLLDGHFNLDIDPLRDFLINWLVYPLPEVVFASVILMFIPVHWAFQFVRSG